MAREEAARRVEEFARAPDDHRFGSKLFGTDLYPARMRLIRCGANRERLRIERRHMGAALRTRQRHPPPGRAYRRVRVGPFGLRSLVAVQFKKTKKNPTTNKL